MNKPEVYQLFVYGSLRSGFHSPAYEYISRYFDLLGEAKVRGELYDLGAFPAAKPTDQDRFIIGELYRIKNISEFSWAIGQLDDYEGVDAAFDETQLYCRKLTTAYCNQQEYPAWIYWYHGDVSDKPKIPSGDILDYISQKK